MIRLYQLLLVALLISLILAGCQPQIPPAATTPPQEPSAPSVIVKEEAQLVLDLPLGGRQDQPGSTSPRVGGISSGGPRSLAVGAQGQVYLWDQGRSRVLVHEAAKLNGWIDVPYVGVAGGDLDVSAGRLYLREPWGQGQLIDYEVEIATGQLLRIATNSSASGTTLYPRSRSQNTLPEKGQSDALGVDAAGNSYRRVVGQDGLDIQRVAPTGTALATAPEPRLQGSSVEDRYVAADGAVYTLVWVWGSQEISRVQVYRLLRPVTPWPIEEAAPPSGPPLVAGIALPAKVTVTFPDWPEVKLDSVLDRQNLWRLLASAQPSDASMASTTRPFSAHLTAQCPDEKTLFFTINDEQISLNGKTYTGPAPQVLRLIHFARSQPAILLASAQQNGATLSILDLPGVERKLTAPEIAKLGQALAGSFVVTADEPQHPLEAPFPRYILTIPLPEGEATIELADHGTQHYLWMGDHCPAGRALNHGGAMTALVKAWLPIPSTPPGTIPYLYQADKVTMNGQDITRWKASLVRHLLGVSQAPSPYDTQVERLNLVFSVDGKDQTVEITKEGFVYAGKRYAQLGLLGLASLQGVP